MPNSQRPLLGGIISPEITLGSCITATCAIVGFIVTIMINIQKVDDLKKTVNDQQNSLTSITVSQSKLENQLTTSQAKFEQGIAIMNSHLEEHDRRLGGVDTEIGRIGVRLGTLETDDAVTKAKIDRIGTDIAVIHSASPEDAPVRYPKR